jgi:hypothetical protein
VGSAGSGWCAHEGLYKSIKEYEDKKEEAEKRGSSVSRWCAPQTGSIRLHARVKRKGRGDGGKQMSYGSRWCAPKMCLPRT